MHGLVHIYHGDGKGKTTAATGLCIRCAGRGGKILFTQFLKDGSSGEVNILKTIDSIEVFSATKNFGFTFQMTKEQKIQAAKYYEGYLNEIIKKVEQTKYDLLILDEIIGACNTKLINEENVREFLMNRGNIEVVLTGQNPSKELCAMGDYITEMKKIRHPFDEGIPSREGIEL